MFFFVNVEDVSIFGKKNTEKNAKQEVSHGTVSSHLSHDRAKGRPTPTRKESEKRQLRPLVADKKAAKRRQREANNKRWKAQQDALMGHGDPRDLPLQDQGKDRKFIRDYIDSRWTLTEFMLPILVIFVAFSFFGPIFTHDVTQPLFVIPVYIMWAIIILGICEVIFYTWRINRYLMKKNHGNYSKKGTGRYVLFRITALRRTRRPVPTVKRGEIPFNPPLR